MDDANASKPTLRPSDWGTPLAFVAAILVGVGVLLTFVYAPTSMGDGFNQFTADTGTNLQISALRGLVFIGAGIVIALFALMARVTLAAWGVSVDLAGKPSTD